MASSNFHLYNMVLFRLLENRSTYLLLSCLYIFYYISQLERYTSSTQIKKVTYFSAKNNEYVQDYTYIHKTYMSIFRDM